MSVLRGSVIYDNITPPDLHQTPFSFGLSCLEHVTGHMTPPANPRPPHRWCRPRPAGTRPWTGRERRRCARERPPAAAARPSPPDGAAAAGGEGARPPGKDARIMWFFRWNPAGGVEKKKEIKYKLQKRLFVTPALLSARKIGGGKRRDNSAAGFMGIPPRPPGPATPGPRRTAAGSKGLPEP